MSGDVQAWRETIQGLGVQLDAARGRVDQLRERRREVALKAHIEGGQAAKLHTNYKREVRAALEEVEDLEDKINAAGERLAAAQAAAGRAAEATRLRQERALAERAVEAAKAADEALAGAAASLAALEQVAAELAATSSRDEGHWRRTDLGGVVVLAMQAAGLGRAFGFPATRSRDPRFGRPLDELVAERFASFMLTDAGIARLAGGDTAGQAGSAEAA